MAQERRKKAEKTTRGTAKEPYEQDTAEYSVDDEPTEQEQPEVYAEAATTETPRYTRRTRGKRADDHESPDTSPDDDKNNGKIHFRTYNSGDDGDSPYHEGCDSIGGMNIRIDDADCQTDEQGEFVVSVRPGRRRIHFREHSEYGAPRTIHVRTGSGELVRLDLDESGGYDLDVYQGTTTYLEVPLRRVPYTYVDRPGKPCGPGNGTIIDAFTRLLKDETITRRIVRLLEEVATEAREDIRHAAGRGQKRQAKQLIALMDDSLAALGGKATRTADSPQCGGSLRVKFESTCSQTWIAGTNVYLFDRKCKNGEVYTGKVATGRSEIHFDDLPSGKYEGYATLLDDVTLEDKYTTKIGGKDAVDCQIQDGHSFEVEICGPGETLMCMGLRYRPRTLQVIVYDDSAGTHEYKGQQRIAGIPVELIHCGKPIVCRNTDEYGCFTYQLDEPGGYLIQTPAMARVNGCAHRQVREGAICIFSAPGDRCPIVVAVGYRRSGATLSLSMREVDNDDPCCNNGEPLTGSIEYGLFDETRTLVRSGTVYTGTPVTMHDLKDDVYELVLKDSDDLEICVPPQGFCRIKASAGQFLDLSGGIHVRRRKENGGIRLHGELRDGEDVLAGNYLELVETETGTVVAKTFANDEGQYSLYTERKLTRLALRIDGYPQLVPVEQDREPRRRSREVETHREDKLEKADFLEAPVLTRQTARSAHQH